MKSPTYFLETPVWTTSVADYRENTHGFPSKTTSGLGLVCRVGLDLGSLYKADFASFAPSSSLLFLSVGPLSVAYSQYCDFSMCCALRIRSVVSYCEKLSFAHLFIVLRRSFAIYSTENKIR